VSKRRGKRAITREPCGQRAGDLFGPLEEFAAWLKGDRDAKRIGNWRTDDCFVAAGQQELGPYIRWLLALKVLLAQQQRPASGRQDDSARLVDRLRHGLEGKAASAVEADFVNAFKHDESNTWRDANRYFAGPLFERIILCLREDLPHRHGILTLEHFREVSNVGLPNGDLGHATVQRFERWLLTGIQPAADNLQGLMCEHFLIEGAEDPREQQLDEIIEQLFDSPTAGQVVNVYSRSAWTGLRAFATELLVRLKHRQREEADPFALVYVRLSRAGAQGEAPTRTSVLRLLRRLFGLPDLDNRLETDRPIYLASDLDDVRCALTLHRTLVVFDALDNALGPMAALFDMIKNTHWGEFIRVLAQPHFKTQTTQGCDYPSRFVVLSGVRVAGLAAWTRYAKPLCPPTAPLSISSLLTQPEIFAGRLEEIRHQLGAQSSCAGLHQIYSLDAAQHSFVFESGLLDGLPGETDLALVSKLDRHDIDEIAALELARPAPCDFRELRRALFARGAQKRAAADPIGNLALKFIAASINGMRLSTLGRCLCDWVDLLRVRPGHDKAFLITLDTQVRAFLQDSLPKFSTTYSELLVQGPAELVEAVGRRQRRFELQHFPDDAQPDDGERAALLIDLRHEEMRELFFAEMGDDSSPTAGDPLPNGREEWHLINLVLAEESLQQATAQLRNLHSRELVSAYVHRRMIQAIYHGLMSHTYDSKAHKRMGELPITPRCALPPQRLKRFRYLYAFLYRKCIENAPEWSLGRSFGRSELRLSLLLMFASPSWVVRLLTQAYKLEDTARKLEDAYLVKSSPLDQRAVRQHLPWIYRDPSLQLDILQALGRAAYDAGRQEFAARLVEAVLTERAKLAALGSSAIAPALPSVHERALQEIEHQVQVLRGNGAGRPAPVRDASELAAFDPVEHSFLKLQVDTLQVRKQLTEAKKCCIEWLGIQGIDAAAICELGKYFDSVGLDAEAGALSQRKRDFDDALQPRVDKVLKACASARHRIAVADMLFRLGEILATAADNREDRDRALEPFLDAYGAYRVADRVRSGGNDFEDGLGWGIVSARQMRNFVRVALKLALMLAAQGDAGSHARHSALAFYAYARQRMDVYVRHLFRLSRERLSMLLLQAAAARVWQEIAPGPATAGTALTSLEDALGYVDQAEAQLLALGAPKPLAYRFFFERAETLNSFADHCKLIHEDSRASTYRALAEIDLRTLQRMAEGNNAFWEDLVQRQRRKFDAGREAQAFIAATQQLVPGWRAAADRSLPNG
jgi:hypothetical protein